MGDGTERLRVQLRDTAQGGRQDDCGSDRIEDGATDALRRTGRGMERGIQQLWKKKERDRRRPQAKDKNTPQPPEPDTEPAAPASRCEGVSRPLDAAPASSPAEPEGTAHTAPKERHDLVSRRNPRQKVVKTREPSGPRAKKDTHPAVRTRERLLIRQTLQRESAPAVDQQGQRISSVRERWTLLKRHRANQSASKGQNASPGHTAPAGQQLRADVPTLPPKAERPSPYYPSQAVHHTTEKAARQSAKAGKGGIKTAKRAARTAERTAKHSIKTAEKSAKQAVKTADKTVKAAQRTARLTAQATRRAAQTAQAAAKATAATVKAAVKATVAAVKAAVAAIEELAAAIAAGGWVVIVVILVICMVGLLLGSVFGIFFSDADSGTGYTMPQAITTLNGEFTDRIEQIKVENTYDELELDNAGTAAMISNWNGVLAVYAVRTAMGDAPTQVATVTAEKLSILREIFWEMNTISSFTEMLPAEPEGDGDGGAEGGEAEAATKVVLHITVTVKDYTQMADLYGFTQEQKDTLAELMGPEYQEMFMHLTGSYQDIALSATQVRQIMEQLPNGLSEERKQVVLTAYQLLGRVNYFWGGKSRVIGWDSRWGTAMEVWAEGSSTTGTVRPYGLDCSGFVDWVFYNVSGGEYIIGRGGGAAAQHTYCTDIAWSQAIPGDLVFYPADEHVGIVCGFDESGNVLVVHCASGYNGVVVTGAGGFTSIGRPVYYGE